MNGIPWSDRQRQGYQLTFSLPDRVEFSENEEWRVKRVGAIKEDLLSYITVYRPSGVGMRIYQLRYEPADLRQPRT